MSWQFSFWILTLDLVILLAENKVPQFALLKARSSNEQIPQISVRFPNGKWDKLVLNRYYASNERSIFKDIENCRFIGRLSEETEACVAMTGCPAGSLDEAVEITILSENVVDTFMYKWYQNGSVIPIEDPFRIATAEVCVTFFGSIRNYILSRNILCCLRPKNTLRFFHSLVIFKRMKIKMNWDWKKILTIDVHVQLQIV